MKTSNLTLLYGIGISVLLIINFLLFSFFDLHTNPNYSLINGIIMAIGIFYALKSFSVNDNIEYNDGFSKTFFVGMNATIIFTVFFSLYSAIIEPNYLSQLMDRLHFKASGTLIIFTVFVMGMATSLVLSLTYMQYFKESWNVSNSEPTKSLE